MAGTRRRTNTRTATRARPKRRPFALGPVLWSLLVLDIALGLAISPITAAHRVRVVGAPEQDQERIARHLQTLRGIPCLRSDRRNVETLIQAGEEIARADFSQNIFGRGVLQIVPRRPVARLDVERPSALSADGTVYATRTDLSDLPLVKVGGLAKAPNLTIAAAWEPGAIAGLCAELTAKWPKSRWTVEVDNIGVLSLYRGSGGIVVLGSTDDLTEKLKRLEKIMEESPDLLDRVRKIDLTSPRNPVYVPRS